VKLWEEKLVRFTIEHAAAKLNIMRGTATPEDHDRKESELFATKDFFYTWVWDPDLHWIRIFGVP